MERRVIVFYLVHERIDRDRRFELFTNLADQRLLRGFSRLDFATREFPPAGKLAIPALSREYLAVMHNDGRNDVDCFHRTLPRFMTKMKASPKLRNAKGFTIPSEQNSSKAKKENALYTQRRPTIPYCRKPPNRATYTFSRV